MKKRFAVGLLVVLLAGIVVFVLKGALFPRDGGRTRKPLLGPSLMSPSPTLRFPALGNEDRQVAKENILACVDLGSKAIPYLEKLCREGSPKEARDAVVALCKISPRKAGDAALGMYGNPDPEVLRAALTVSARAKDERAKENILSLTGHPDALVAARAVEAVVFVFEPRMALDILAGKLEAKEAYIRDAADRALEALTYRDFGYSHSDYESLRKPAIAGVKKWIASNGGKSRFEWLQARVAECMEDLTGEDLYKRNDADEFLTGILGENDYIFNQSPAELKKSAEALRKKWREYSVLFADNPPLNLYMELE